MQRSIVIAVCFYTCALASAQMTPDPKHGKAKPQTLTKVNAGEVTVLPVNPHISTIRSGYKALGADEHLNELVSAGARLGYGYDSIKGQILTTPCVYVPFVETNYPGTIPDVIDLVGHVDEVTSLSQLVSHSGVSASASLTYKIFSFGASGSATETDYYRSWYHYIDFNVEVDRYTKTFQPLYYTPAAHQADADGRFNDVCGDQFIFAVHYGASLKGQVVAKTVDQQHGETHQADVSAGITGLLGLKGSSKTDSDNIVKNSEVKNYVKALGIPAVDIDGIDTVIQKAYHFPTLTKNSNEIVSWELADYEHLAERPPDSLKKISVATQTALAALAANRDQAVTQANDLRFAVGKPMYSIKPEDQKTELLATTKYLIKIADVVDTCEAAGDASCQQKAKDALNDGVPPTTLALKP